jgi:hypothetical protein
VFAALGDVDELNSALGVAREFCSPSGHGFLPQQVASRRGGRGAAGTAAPPGCDGACQEGPAGCSASSTLPSAPPSLLRATPPPLPRPHPQLAFIQSRLLDVGSAVATPLEGSSERKVARVQFDASATLRLEVRLEGGEACWSQQGLVCCLGCVEAVARPADPAGLRLNLRPPPPPLTYPTPPHPPPPQVVDRHDGRRPAGPQKLHPAVGRQGGGVPAHGARGELGGVWGWGVGSGVGVQGGWVVGEVGGGRRRSCTWCARWVRLGVGWGGGGCGPHRAWTRPRGLPAPSPSPLQPAAECRLVCASQIVLPRIPTPAPPPGAPDLPPRRARGVGACAVPRRRR